MREARQAYPEGGGGRVDGSNYRDLIDKENERIERIKKELGKKRPSRKDTKKILKANKKKWKEIIKRAKLPEKIGQKLLNKITRFNQAVNLILWIEEQNELAKMHDAMNVELTDAINKRDFYTGVYEALSEEDGADSDESDDVASDSSDEPLEPTGGRKNSLRIRPIM